MSDVRDKLADQLAQAVSALLAEAGDSGGDPPEVSLSIPRQKSHGDFACNVAMQLAGRLRKSPRDIGTALVEKLGDAGGLVARSEVAGPGFVNVWLAEARWLDVLRGILEAGERYGRSNEGKQRRVQVEFVSANPTGPLSTGHGRQGVLGDCIARLLDFTDWDVTREFYFNDGGRQMRVLGESVKARYLECLNEAAPPPESALEDPENAWIERVGDLPVVFPRDGYRGEYVREIAESLRGEKGAALVDEEATGVFLSAAKETIFAEIRSTLDTIGIHFDEYFNEKSLYDDGQLDAVLAEMRAQGMIYEAEGAVWFKATALGLDRDRVVVRSNGEPTYLLPDIAYHRDKYRRGFEAIIDVMGADHIEQFPFVRAAVGALGCDPQRLELVLHQFVTITSGGEKLKQSTRRANFVTIDELVEEVGVDVFRFFMVERKADGHLDFDLDLAKDRNWKKNPAYYVQYAHARTHGIQRKAAELGAAAAGAFDAGRLVLSEEIELIRKLGEFPGLVRRAAETREPHHVAYYLRDLAGLFHPYVQDGTRHRVVSDDAGLTSARLALMRAVQVVLANGLWLLGISAPEQM
ncbi:MAG: arginine--tRNA ligase [Myxococcota bacterium]